MENGESYRSETRIPRTPVDPAEIEDSQSVFALVVEYSSAALNSPVWGKGRYFRVRQGWTGRQMG